MTVMDEKVRLRSSSWVQKRVQKQEVSRGRGRVGKRRRLSTKRGRCMISGIKCRRVTRSEWRSWIWSSWRCRGFVEMVSGGEKCTIRDGVFNEQTGKLEDKVIMSGSTLEYMRENWGGRGAEYSFDTIVKLAEWHVKGKYPRMIARLPREMA